MPNQLLIIRNCSAGECLTEAGNYHQFFGERHLDFAAKNHLIKPGQKLLGVSGENNQPGVFAIVNDLNVFFYATVGIEQQSISALTWLDVQQILRKHGVQPRESIFARDANNRLVIDERDSS